jgi:hypothetical protein
MRKERHSKETMTVSNKTEVQSDYSVLITSKSRKEETGIVHLYTVHTCGRTDAICDGTESN